MSNERPWLANYPAGVPAQIDTGRYASVVAVVEETYATGVRLTPAEMRELEREISRLPGLERWFVEIPATARDG